MRKGIPSDLIARILGGSPKWTIVELEKKFPKRNLPDTAMITRVAPSPTGYMHIGGLYQALLDWKLAQQSGGVFMLRIEDTDTKREVMDAAKIIIDSLNKFGLNYNNLSEYGPYFQSQRRDIYHSVVAELLADGRAYPCFLTADDMEKIRAEQSASGLPTGIYGDFARDRDLGEDEISARLDAGEIPSIRLYSTGDRTQKIFCKDAVRGSIAFPQNDEDIVLIKSNDKLPTYHFAHLVDDYFMRTTNVVRGEEWLPSFPLHIQLFNMIGWPVPAYIHTSTIDKIDVDTGKQRKLSKRKDPEANIETFLSDGWPVESVKNYLFNIMAPGFEEAKAKNPDTTIENYDLKIKKIPTSGALFDWKKLEWWAREFIATLPVDELVSRVVAWANEYGDENHKSAISNQQYLKNILSIERDNPKRIRKDFITWSQTLDEIAYFFDDLFEIKDWKLEIGNEFLKTFSIDDDKDTWWGKIQKIAADFDIKPGDAAMQLRVAITGRTNTPDLYSIMQVMGQDRVQKRVENVIKYKG